MSPERINPSTGSDDELARQHIARYMFARAFVENKTVVDIACGTGYGSKILAESGAKIVHGIDISSEAIAVAKRTHQLANIIYHEGSVECLRTLNNVEVIISYETIEHIQEPEIFIESLASSLPQTGKLIISTPVRQMGSLSDTPENPFHVREWNIQEFNAFLDKYFSSKDIYFQFVYKKLPYPGSRTITKAFASLFYPDQAKILSSSVIIKECPSMGLIPITEGYIIAICKK